MVVPRDVDEAILKTERDELVRGKKCALHVSPFEPAIAADELLLQTGVANTTYQKCDDYEHASHEIMAASPGLECLRTAAQDRCGKYHAAFAVSISSVYLPNRALLLHHAR